MVGVAAWRDWSLRKRTAMEDWREMCASMSSQVKGMGMGALETRRSKDTWRRCFFAGRAAMAASSSAVADAIGGRPELGIPSRNEGRVGWLVGVLECVSH